MSYSPPKPTVLPFIRVTSYFSLTTNLPLYVGFLGPPAVIGSVASRRPSRTTVMVWAAASTVETWERPMVKATFFCWMPYASAAPRTSRSRRSRVTLVPGFQYARGRKSSRPAPNQWAATSVRGSAVTLTARSTAARSVTGRLKSRETIIPVPTVERCSGRK